MNSRSSIVLLLLLLGGVGAAGWLVLRDREPEDAGMQLPAPTTRPTSAPAPASAPATQPFAKKPNLDIVKNPADPGRYMLLPDNSYAPVLNDAYGAPPLEWPAEKPWSKIVGKNKDSFGNEWYQHEDGSQSTTLMVYRSDVDRKVPVSCTANPTQPLPVLLEGPRPHGPIGGQDKPGSQPTPGK